MVVVVRGRGGGGRGLRAPWRAPALGHARRTGHSCSAPHVRGDGRPFATQVLVWPPQLQGSVGTGQRRRNGLQGVSSAILWSAVWSSLVTGPPPPLLHRMVHNETQI